MTFYHGWSIMRKTTVSKSTKYILSLLFCCSYSAIGSDIEVKAIVEGGFVNAEYDKPWLNSWLEQGVGIQRFNKDDEFLLTQAAIEVSGELYSDITFDIVGNYNPDGRQHVGLTEAFLNYAPLTKGLKHKVKVGMFYPQMSLENSAVGWNSPYTYTFSAINSWIAEEQRTIGVEWSATRGGRKYNSPHTFTAVASAFKANDGLGTLLVWRGWAVHNRQTVYNEKVNFANYFAFEQNIIVTPNYVEPLVETDGKWGYYLGLHWRYLRKTDVRVYYYNNRGNPFAIEADRQYAWETDYYSISLMHKFTKNFRVLAQWLTGATGMGSLEEGVFADISSKYVMFSYKMGKHRVSFRHEQFDVDEFDVNHYDPNDSDGDSNTLAWRYQYDKNWQLGLEYTESTSNNESRTLWPNWAPKHTQKQTMAIVQYRF